MIGADDVDCSSIDGGDSESALEVSPVFFAVLRIRIERGDPLEALDDTISLLRREVRWQPC